MKCNKEFSTWLKFKGIEKENTKQFMLNDFFKDMMGWKGYKFCEKDKVWLRGDEKLSDEMARQAFWGEG